MSSGTWGKLIKKMLECKNRGLTVVKHLSYVLKGSPGNFVVCNKKRAAHIIVTLTLLVWQNYNDDSNGRKEMVK